MRALVWLTLALAAAAATWLVQPNVILSLRSPRVLAWIAGGALLCAVIRRIARRLGASRVVALSLAAVPAVVAIGLVVIKPIVDPRELTESFPQPVAAATTAPLPEATTAAPVPVPVPKSTTAAPVRLAPRTRATTAGPVRSSAPATAVSPTRLATGRLTPLDGHSASGSVSTFRLADGSHIIRFENVRISGTPSPEVYLLTGRNRTGKSGGLHLGALKAERGSFNYALPSRFVGTDFTVLVWCEHFAVNIAHATQPA